MIKKALLLGLFLCLTGCATVSNTHVQENNTFKPYLTQRSEIKSSWGQPDREDNNTMVYSRTWAVSDGWALFRPQWADNELKGEKVTVTFVFDKENRLLHQYSQREDFTTKKSFNIYK